MNRLRTYLALAWLVAGCAVPQPVPDLFQERAHGDSYEPYVPRDQTIWTHSYDPPDIVTEPPYYEPLPYDGVDHNDYQQAPDPDAYERQ